MTGALWIGTSGWNYKHWRDIFYPHFLNSKEWLQYYSLCFNSVEVNTTFYGMPKSQTFENWRAATPPWFTFTLKISRLFTHVYRLQQPEEYINKLLEQASPLGDKLRMILIQLPDRMEYARGKLEATLLAIRTQSYRPGLRCALEIRDRSWYNREAMKMLQKFDTALVQTDWPGFTNHGPQTASFRYVRRHGPGALYASKYSEDALQIEAEQIQECLLAGQDVTIYYNNDSAGYAVQNAIRLAQMINLQDK